MNIEQNLSEIKEMISDLQIQSQDILDLNSCSKYIGCSKSHLYKLTHLNKIPHYKPNGKKIYFNRLEINDWLLQNRSSTNEEIEKQASDYLIKKGKVKL